MSWHLENGFRFREPDLYTIHLQMMNLRKAARPVVLDLASRYTAEAATSLLDRRAVGLETSSAKHGSILAEVMKDVWDRQRRVESTKERDPAIDFSFEIAILPMVGRTLGVYYTEQKALSKLLHSQSWFVDWSYQNATDPDEDVPELEWKERETDWRGLLEKDGIVAKHGFCATIIEPECYPMLRPEMIIPFVPVFKDRVKHVVKDRLFNEFVKIQPTIDSSNVISTMIAFQKWLETDEGKAAVQADSKVVSRLLCHTITPEGLTS